MHGKDSIQKTVPSLQASQGSRGLSDSADGQGQEAVGGIPLPSPKKSVIKVDI